jgi:carbon monoxide dehydrogenase subunit G
MELAHVIEEIDAPIERVWAELGDFSAVQRLFPPEGVSGFAALEKVTFRGEGIGFVRTVHLVDGQSQDEVLEAVDEANYSYNYSAPAPNLLGVEGYYATVTMTAIGPAKTRINYRSEGTPGADFPIERLRPVLTDIYKALINGARKLAMATA